VRSLVLLLTFSISTLAMGAIKSGSYVNQVEKKLNTLFSDTVNEGGNRAVVERVKGKPGIKCGDIVRSNGKAVIFCTAKIKTSFYSGGKKKKGSTICTSLSFVIKNNKVTERHREEAFRMCMENIHDASY